MEGNYFRRALRIDLSVLIKAKANHLTNRVFFLIMLAVKSENRSCASIRSDVSRFGCSLYGVMDATGTNCFILVTAACIFLKLFCIGMFLSDNSYCKFPAGDHPGTTTTEGPSLSALRSTGYVLFPVLMNSP